MNQSSDQSNDRPVVIDSATVPVDRWSDPERGSITGDQPLRILYGFPTDSFDDVQYIFGPPAAQS